MNFVLKNYQNYKTLGIYDYTNKDYKPIFKIIGHLGELGGSYDGEAHQVIVIKSFLNQKINF